MAGWTSIYGLQWLLRSRWITSNWVEMIAGTWSLTIWGAGNVALGHWISLESDGPSCEVEQQKKQNCTKNPGFGDLKQVQDIYISISIYIYIYKYILCMCVYIYIFMNPVPYINFWPFLANFKYFSGFAGLSSWCATSSDSLRCGGKKGLPGCPGCSELDAFQVLWVSTCYQDMLRENPEDWLWLCSFKSLTKKRFNISRN